MPKKPNPKKEKRHCTMCGKALPEGYGYDVCVHCRIKCPLSTNSGKTHEFITSLSEGCRCKFCGMGVGDCFRGFDDDH